MLPKANRLRRNKDFSKVYQKGCRQKGPDLVLRALPNPKKNSEIDEAEGAKTASPTRVGISIGKKVSKHAVVRNRLKRQIRAAMKVLLPKIKPGWDLAIVVKKTAPRCNYHQILQQLEQLLAKAEVLDGH
ncbi:MAG: ribonuclease P protein component [Cyanobacteriota bacterium]|nr:ribonuclease P protein component [Cyanobacteriota bacterium]